MELLTAISCVSTLLLDTLNVIWPFCILCGEVNSANVMFVKELRLPNGIDQRYCNTPEPPLNLVKSAPEKFTCMLMV